MPSVSAVADSYSVVHDQVLATTGDGSNSLFGVLHNDTNPDGVGLTVTEINGAAYSPDTPITLAHGSLTFGCYGNGSFSYTPDPGYVGSESFNYTVFDGVFSDTATVTISVTNQAPTAVDNSYDVLHHQVLATTGDGSNSLFGVVHNDTDPDGDPLIVSAINGVAYSPDTPIALAHGSLTFGCYGNGSFSYTPDSGFAGDDSFTYVAFDGAASSNTATVTIHVTNTAPEVAGDAYCVVHDRALSSIDLTQYASDADGDSLQISIVSGPGHGDLTQCSDGTYSFTPDAGWTGTDSFTFKANDGAADSNTATITIAVTNTAPVAQAEQFYLHAGNTLTLASTAGLKHDAYDADNDPLVVQLVGDAPENGTLDLQADGSMTYTADVGFTGDDTFSYRLSDGAAYSETVQVTIHVHNQAPVASPNTFDVWTDQGISEGDANVLANATDADGDPLTAVLVTGPQYADSFHLNANGTFTYTPTATPPENFDGVDSFVINANDGTTDSAPVTVTLKWTTMPVAKDDAYIVDDTGHLYVAAAGGVLKDDYNPMDAELEAEVEDDLDADIGSVDLDEDGGLDFTAGPNFEGEAIFTYRLFIQVGNVFVPGTTAVVRILSSAVIAASTNLYSVAFDSNTTIAPDNPVDVPYESPQWKISNPTDADRDPARAYSISFTRHTAIGMTPVFKPIQGTDPDVVALMNAFWRSCGNNILVRAEHAADEDAPIYQLGYDSQNIRLHLDGNNLTTDGFARMDNDTLLPNTTAYYPSLAFNWQISPDGGVTWVTPAGATSRNQTFVTLSRPAAPSTPLTVLYAGVENSAGGNGATDNASLVSMIWSGFTALGITSADGTPMRYWGGWQTNITTTVGLISGGNGQCYSWASLFTDTLKAWGYSDAVTKERIDTNPVAKSYGAVPILAEEGGALPTNFLVGNWSEGQYITCNSLPILRGWSSYAVIPTVADTPTVPQWIGQNGGYVWNNGPQYTPSPAQNNPNPKSDFQNHMVVSINGTLYDPSYGVTYASLGAFANTLGGFMWIMPFNNRVYQFDLNGSGIDNNTSYWIALFQPIDASMLTMNGV